MTPGERVENLVHLKPSELYETIKHCITNKLNLLIVGKPGIGKTRLVLDACQELQIDCITSSPAVEDPTDTKGIGFYDPSKKMADWSLFPDMVKLLTANTRTVYFMDDFGQAPESIQKAKMALMNPGVINGQPISKEIVFISATNSKADKAGRRPGRPGAGPRQRTRRRTRRPAGRTTAPRRSRTRGRRRTGRRHPGPGHRTGKPGPAAGRPAAETERPRQMRRSERLPRQRRKWKPHGPGKSRTRGKPENRKSAGP